MNTNSLLFNNNNIIIIVIIILLKKMHFSFLFAFLLIMTMNFLADMHNKIAEMLYGKHVLQCQV